MMQDRVLTSLLLLLLDKEGVQGLQTTTQEAQKSLRKDLDGEVRRAEQSVET